MIKIPFSLRYFVLPLIAVGFILSGCGNTTKSAKTWEIAPEGVFSAAFSNQFVLLGSVDGNAELWDLKRNTQTYSWQHGNDRSGGIIAVAISDNEKYALTAQRNSLVWWRIRDSRIMGSWNLDSIQSATLSKDGQFALIGLEDRAIYFALRYGKALFSFEHDGRITSTDLSADRRYALTGSRDKSAKLWRLSDGRNVHTWPHRLEIAALAIGPGNRYVLTNEALGSTRLWSVKTGKLEKTIGPERMTLSAAIFSPNGKYLATGRTSQGIDLWRIQSGQNIKHWTPKKSSFWRPSASTVLALEFTSTGRNLLSATSQGSIQLWNMR